MLLTDLISHPDTSRYYLERYVNDGSPSGFSTLNTTKHRTSPFELTSWFNPLICYAPSMYFKEYGVIPNISINNEAKDKNWIMVHPDMINNLFFSHKNFNLKLLDDIKVYPTASGRTIQIIDKESNYVKLHYEGILGRIRRELPFQKAIAGPEISKFISRAISNKSLNKKISILPEPGARVLINEDYKYSEWGMIWRENKPYGLEKNSYHFLFPSFSLFSMDRVNTHHFPLIKQIIDYLGVNPETYILEVILLPLIECYFDIVLKLGLQPELNSQNLLLGFNEDFSECSFIIRDLESIDKDLSLMEYLGLDYKSDSYPYKCIEKSQYNYKIKHSFMYDFKLGESILDPIIKTAMKYYDLDYYKIQNKIKEYANTHIKNLPQDFYPTDKWYVFDKVLVDQNKPERPYIEYSNPKFR